MGSSDPQQPGFINKPPFNMFQSPGITNPNPDGLLSGQQPQQPLLDQQRINNPNLQQQPLPQPGQQRQGLPLEFYGGQQPSLSADIGLVNPSTPSGIQSAPSISGGLLNNIGGQQPLQQSFPSPVQQQPIQPQQLPQPQQPQQPNQQGNFRFDLGGNRRARLPGQRIGPPSIFGQQGQQPQQSQQQQPFQQQRQQIHQGFLQRFSNPQQPDPIFMALVQMLNRR